MGLETATFINDLVTANPVGATDLRRAGDDHLRLIKNVLKTTFPSATFAVSHWNATGGDKGLGTLNQTGYYLNGVDIATVFGGANSGGGGNALRRNGGFEIWQRGAGGAASIAVAASTTLYTADGWYLTTNANQASVVSQQAGLTDGSQWSGKVLRNSGQTGTGAYIFGFPLDTDEIYPLLNQFVRVSFTAKAGANWSPASGSLTVNLAAGTGTPAKVAAFAGRTNPINTVQNLTTTPTRYQFNSAAVIPTNVRQMDMTFQWVPVGTAGADDSFTIDDVQLEIVPAASGFVSSPFQRLNFTETLRLCQTHYFKYFGYDLAPAQNAGGKDAFMFPQPVAASSALGGVFVSPRALFRKLPAVTGFNPLAANAQIRNFTRGTDFTGTSIGIINSSPESFYLTGTTPAGSFVGDLCMVGLTFDAGI